MDPSPSVHAWEVDTTPPETFCQYTRDGRWHHFAPRALLSETRRSPDSDCTFEYRINGGRWEPTTGTVRKEFSGEGKYVFQLRARDRAGNQDLTPYEQEVFVIN